MENKITIDLDTFKFILNQESRKTVGIIMKRFEITENKEEIKKEVKELIHEAYRNVYDIFQDGRILLEKSKAL